MSQGGVKLLDPQEACADDRGQICSLSSSGPGHSRPDGTGCSDRCASRPSTSRAAARSARWPGRCSASRSANSGSSAASSTVSFWYAMIRPEPDRLHRHRYPIAPGARRSQLPARPGWRRPRPAARSAGGPSRDRSVRSARGAGSAGDVALDCAERRLRAFGESTARRASRPGRSSASGGPAAGSIARCRDGRSPRSPPGAEASAARARPSWPLRRSDGEPLAPLGPTTSEHAATALRGHPGHEAMLALARALLGLIRPLHRCVPFPRSAFAIRAIKHTNGWRSASLRANPDGPSRSGAGFYRRPARRSNTRRARTSTPARRGRSSPTDGSDPLPRRFGRCYSGPTPGPDRPKRRPISARRRTHQPSGNPARSVRSTSV